MSWAFTSARPISPGVRKLVKQQGKARHIITLLGERLEASTSRQPTAHGLNMTSTASGRIPSKCKRNALCLRGNVRPRHRDDADASAPDSSNSHDTGIDIAFRPTTRPSPSPSGGLRYGLDLIRRRLSTNWRRRLAWEEVSAITESAMRGEMDFMSLQAPGAAQGAGRPSWRRLPSACPSDGANG
jgi:hypothetical protein